MAQPVKPFGELVRRALELIMRDQPAATRTLSECLASVDTPEGRQRVADYLESEPFPHLKGHPTKRIVLERIEADGSRQFGRFKGRKWVLETRN